MTISAAARATRSAQSLWKDDAASLWLGLELGEVTPGFAVLHLDIQPHHANGHGICHGGFIFTLADTAFAFACNSYNQVTVAQHNAITYISPGKLGDKLTAKAVEVNRSGRSGVYDVTVTNQNDDLIAILRGHSRTLKGTLFDESVQA